MATGSRISVYIPVHCARVADMLTIASHEFGVKTEQIDLPPSIVRSLLPGALLPAPLDTIAAQERLQALVALDALSKAYTHQIQQLDQPHRVICQALRHIQNNRQVMPYKG